MHGCFVLGAGFWRLLGIKAMEQAEFQDWLSAADRLTSTRRSSGTFSESRICPRCGAGGTVWKGMTRGLLRYLCRSCDRTFNAAAGTPPHGLRKKEHWLSFGKSSAERETVAKSARHCRIAHTTAFRWRHRFLNASRRDSGTLGGIVEADETYLLRSRKGLRSLARPLRRRVGKVAKRGLSKHLVPNLFAANGGTFRKPLDSAQAAEIAEALRAGSGKGFHPRDGRGALLRPVRGRSGCPTWPRTGPPTNAFGAVPHTDGRQPARPLQAVPVRFPRRRDEISRKLPGVVTDRLPRRRQCAMHAIRKMSQRIDFRVSRGRSHAIALLESIHLIDNYTLSEYSNSVKTIWNLDAGVKL